MTYTLGVDLGTSTSAAALRRGTGLEVCALGDLAATMPSVAIERSDGSVLVGEAAAERAWYDTTLVARHIGARLAGSEAIVLDGRPHDPALLTQALLEAVVDRVGRLYGDRPPQVVLTYPLYPPGPWPELLQRVGDAAVGRALLIPHPVAAVAKLAHDIDIAVGTTVAVLDFGGGTFEATIMRRSAGGFDVVGKPGGLADLGGVEIDDAVFARVDARLGHVLQAVAPDDAEGMAALRRLRAACRVAKEQLSYGPEASVEVALPGLSTWVPVTRADLEDDIRPWLMATVDVVADIIAGAGLAPADIHVALLVGGSSRIPLFGELIAGRLGVPVVADPFPELTVALGAALFGDDDTPGARPESIAAAGPGAALAVPWDDLPGDVGEADADDEPWHDRGSDDGWDGSGDEWGDSGDEWGDSGDDWDGSGDDWGDSGDGWNGEGDGWNGEGDGWDGWGDGGAGPSAAAAGGRRPDGSDPRLVLAVIGGALAIVGIAGAALAGGMAGPDEPSLTLADPARSAITTSTTGPTTTSTTTSTTTTTTEPPTTTTTEPEPVEEEEEWEPPPPPPTAPSTTSPPATAPSTTTSVPPTTTTAPPTTSSTPSTTDPPSCADPGGGARPTATSSPTPTTVPCE